MLAEHLERALDAGVVTHNPAALDSHNASPEFLCNAFLAGCAHLLEPQAFKRAVLSALGVVCSHESLINVASDLARLS